MSEKEKKYYLCRLCNHITEADTMKSKIECPEEGCDGIAVRITKEEYLSF